MTRRVIFQLLILGALWFTVAHLADAQRLLTVFRQGRWAWTLAAVGVQALYFLIFTAVYQSAFATVGVASSLRQLLPVVFASVAVNVTTPAAGFGGAALFVDDASRRGQPPGRAAAGLLLTLIADLAAFMLLLVAGLAVLFTHRDLRLYEILAAAALFGLVAVLSLVLLAGLWRPQWVRRLLLWAQAVQQWIARRLFRGRGAPGDWADRTAAEFGEAASAVAAHPRRLARTVGIALAAHLADLAGLYLLVLAFHGPVGPGVLVAGYAMGILFWNISVTPQGIGVVEGVMTLVFASLGIPIERAAVITLAFRGVTFWLPMAVGFVILRRVRSFAAEVETQTTLWGVRIAAALTAVTGMVNVISGIIPSLPTRMGAAEHLPLVVRHGARAAAVLAGFALLTLAVSLWRRKRIAWYLTLLALGASLISHLLKGLDYEEALLALVAGTVLLFERRHFQARSDPPSVRRGLWAAAFALIFALGYGTAGFYLLDRHFRTHFGLGAALRQTLVMFTEYADPGLQPVTGFGRYFADSIYVVGAVTAGYALLMVLRPVLLRTAASSADHVRAQRIVEEFGHSSLARFTLFPDKAYYFTPGGSVVAFAVKGRVALALGDPIGSPEDAGRAIREFRDHCALNDWTPAFYQTLPDSLPAYRAAGFHALHIGDEGIVPLAGFSLEGKESKTLRGAVNRLSRGGFEAILHDPPLAGNLLEELRQVSGDWLAMMHGAEKGFSLGWFDDDYIRRSPVMAVHGPDGRAVAFANIIPEYQINETTIDLMRRRSDAPPGTMDFLFVRLLQWAAGRGYATFNLGLSPLAGVGLRGGAPAVERALHFLYEHLNQFYNFKGLHTFKEKFRPQWTPRYLIYTDFASLPAVALALFRADAGDRFVLDYLQERWPVLHSRAG